MNWPDALHVARYVFGGGLLVANVGVWYGVWLEREASPKEVQAKGWRILVTALAAEAALGMFLFAADTGIDIMQRHENAATNERASNAELEAGRLGVKVGNISAFVSRKSGDLDTAISSLNGAEAKANKRLGEVEKNQAARELSVSQQTELIRVADRFSGQPFAIYILDGREQDLPFANAILHILLRAGWKGYGLPPGQAPEVFKAIFSGPPLTDIQITVNQTEQSAGHAPPGATAVAKLFAGWKLARPNALYINQAVPVGVIEIKIGPKTGLN